MLNQNEVDARRLMAEGRLNINEPAQRKYIDSMIAMLAVSDPEEAKRIQCLYKLCTDDQCQPEAEEAKQEVKPKKKK